MRILTPEQHAQIVEALNTAVDNAKNHAENVHESYRGYYPERHAAADRDVIDATIALTTLQALPEVEVAAYASYGEQINKPLYAKKEPS